jgi:nucleolar complex protein 3
MGGKMKASKKATTKTVKKKLTIVEKAREKRLAREQKLQEDSKQGEKKDEEKPHHEDDDHNGTDETAALGGGYEDVATGLSVSETCDLIADLSESILENPDQAYAAVQVEGSSSSSSGNNKSNNNREPSRMQQLFALASRADTLEQKYTSRLAIMSLLAIFKDILPAYRIRIPTAKEMAVKVSKETKKIWDAERNLLNFYQRFLQLLEGIWKSEGTSADANDEPTAYAMTAMLSMAELLKSAFHFNFRSNLITAVVRQMNSRHEPIREACCGAIAYVFANDAQADVSLEASRQVAKMIKDRGLHTHPAVMKTFVALPLRVHADEAEAAKIAQQVNAKKRKRDKEAATIESELREGQATVDKILLARNQSDILQAVTLTYFRVLKSDNMQAPSVQRLLPVALEGLAKFAHLINIDTVQDLLDVMKVLLKQIDCLPVEAAMNCILTAFSTLQGPGREMPIDQKEYIAPLYSQLPRLCTEEHNPRVTDVAVECLNAAFIKRREFSTVRVAAFMKQILTTAMHTPPSTSIPLIAFVRQLIQRYPSAEQMLENEQDVITSGAYQLDVEDPEHSNPFATSAWELATLQFHYNPSIAHQASSAASAKMLQFPAESPDKLRSECLASMTDLYIPCKRFKKKHPLEPTATTTSSSNATDKKRVQHRFISPRAFASQFV